MKTIILSAAVTFALIAVSSAAFGAETYSKLDCKTVKGKQECKVTKLPKISDSITYLDMSETEGKEDSLPKIAPKGKL